MANFEGSCPYCGQVNLSGEDPRMLCGCVQAREYRRIWTALNEASIGKSPMREIDEDIMQVLYDTAHQIAAHNVVSAVMKLGDGTTVSIGGKVSRKAQVKVEKKVDD